MKKLIAKTTMGKEYLHSREYSFFASSNAKKIAEILNSNNYKIKENEKWYVYDFDFMQETYVNNRIFISKDGKIKSKSLQ